MRFVGFCGFYPFKLCLHCGLLEAGRPGADELYGNNDTGVLIRFWAWNVSSEVNQRVWVLACIFTPRWDEPNSQYLSNSW